MKDVQGKPNEEYFKWQFISSIVDSGLCFRDYIGVEVYLPKGNKNAAPLKVDACIFDTNDWLTHYQRYRADSRNNTSSLEFLRNHLICVVEFKRARDNLERTFATQLKPAMNESESAFVLGVLYDAERLYLFERPENSRKILRYDETKNRGEGKTPDLSFSLPDSYLLFPNFDELVRRINRPASINRSNRSIHDLDIITSRSSVQIKDTLSRILRTLDRHSLVSQKGYQILIQTLAMKIFDEKRNQRDSNIPLHFCVTDEEINFHSLADTAIQDFIERMQVLYDEAEESYHNILSQREIDWQNESHIRAVQQIMKEFQDYSLVLSHHTDLYQLVFYNFAQPFQKIVHAQFLTPLPVIDFLVSIVNPRRNDKICDPCVGIADFLSLSYVKSTNSGQSVDDQNLYGVDIEESMLALAQLNMLLNGDGRAHLLKAEDEGSIVHKIRSDGSLTSLIHSYHKYNEDPAIKRADWDNWPDRTRLMKFDVVLTNPPFGEDRAFEGNTEQKRQILELYETYWLSGRPPRMDKGVIFLENTYHLLGTEGRFGIVLSNAIASEDKSFPIINWLLEKMRVVAMFDLPPDVFGETGVNTTLIVAYKPQNEELQRLKSQNYSVFSKSISKIGYEKKTKKRNVVFENKFKIDPTTFQIVIDENGAPVLDEEFTQIEKEFREWSVSQEETLQRIFIR